MKAVFLIAILVTSLCSFGASEPAKRVAGGRLFEMEKFRFYLAERARAKTAKQAEPQNPYPGWFQFSGNIVTNSPYGWVIRATESTGNKEFYMALRNLPAVNWSSGKPFSQGMNIHFCAMTTGAQVSVAAAGYQRRAIIYDFGLPVQ